MGKDHDRLRSLETSAWTACPSCGENLEIAVDASGGRRQRYIEDCEVCCRPMEVWVEWQADGGLDVTVRSPTD